jgi:type IV pilus assembly protein PilZ
MNQRRHSRVPVALAVRFLSRGDLERDIVSDLSPGGLFVRTSKPLDIGTDVDLELLLADETPIHVRGRVMWLRRSPDARPGMGIQFTGPLGPLLVEMVAAVARVH